MTIRSIRILAPAQPPSFNALLQDIAAKPGKYVGKVSLTSVADYLAGYVHAMHDMETAEKPLDGWIRWVEMRFLISHSAWHWTRILLHAYGDDASALAALPELYTEFLADRAELGVTGIEAEHRRRLLALYGKEWHAPLDSGAATDL